MFSLAQFDLLTLLFIAGTIGFAGLVHGTLGLGFPMVATPILAITMDVRSAILVTLLPTVAVNVASIIRSDNSIKSAAQFSPLIVFSLIGALLGAWLLASVDPSPFRLVLAGLIIIYLLTSRFSAISFGWFSQHPISAMALFGICAGMAGGITNVMVAILIIYFIALETPRQILVPALNSCFLAGKLSQILILSLAGMVGLGLIIETSPLAIVAVVCLLGGQKLQNRINVKLYQSILRKLLLVLAILLIGLFFKDLITY